MITTLIILALSAVFFVNGKIRSDLVALCALVLLMVFNILTPEEALSGFSNSVVIMMVGLFVVGGAIFKTGLAKMIGSKILQLAGTSEIKPFHSDHVGNSLYRGVRQQHRNRCPYATYRCQYGCKCQYQPEPFPDAFSIRK